MKFSGKKVEIARPRTEVFDRISNLEQYQQYLDQLPAEVRGKVGDVRFTPDAIVITAAPVGEIVLRVTRRQAPELMVLEAENSPVPMAVNISLAENGEGTTLSPDLNVEIPAMMRAFVGPKLQEAADKMGEMLGMLFNGQK